jgi:hypothetical protein
VDGFLKGKGGFCISMNSSKYLLFVVQIINLQVFYEIDMIVLYKKIQK